MKKNKILTWILGTLAILAFPVLINIFASIPTPWTQVDNDWIGFFGNYVGALIGGMIAYFVARIQIDNMKSQEREQRLIRQLPALVQLHYEILKVRVDLENNMRALNSIQRLTDEEILGFYILLMKLENELWYKIDPIDDIKLMQDIIRFREDFIKMQETMSKDYCVIQLDLKNSQERLNTLQALSSISTQEEIEKQNLIKQITFLNYESEFIKRSKPNEYKKIVDGTYLVRIKIIEEQLDTTIIRINQLKVIK